VSDLLNMEKLNSTPQPFFVATSSTSPFWPVESIDVETGLMRIDVCGKLDLMHFGAIVRMRDLNGTELDPDDFYNEEPK
jgi:hypothetical protein